MDNRNLLPIVLKKKKKKLESARENVTCPAVLIAAGGGKYHGKTVTGRGLRGVDEESSP